MLIQIIINSSFGIAKTLFKIIKKCLKSTLNADLSQCEGYNVKKRCEQAGVRRCLTLPLALRGYCCFWYFVNILHGLCIALMAVFSIPGSILL